MNDLTEAVRQTKISELWTSYHVSFVIFCYHSFQQFTVILDIAEILIWQFVLFSFFAVQALSLKIKRRGQSFADKKCYKSVQIIFAGEAF